MCQYDNISFTLIKGEIGKLSNCDQIQVTMCRGLGSPCGRGHLFSFEIQLPKSRFEPMTNLHSPNQNACRVCKWCNMREYIDLSDHERERGGQGLILPHLVQ